MSISSTNNLKSSWHHGASSNVMNLLKLVEPRVRAKRVCMLSGVHVGNFKLTFPGCFRLATRAPPNIHFRQNSSLPKVMHTY